MRIVKIAHSSPATALPALSRQPVPRARARVLPIPPLVLPAAVLGAKGLALALARTTNQLNALKAQKVPPENGHKTQPLAPEAQKTDWFELAKWAGPVAALLIFSLNQNQQIGALAARQDGFKDTLKDSLGLIRDDLRLIRSDISALDSKINTLGQEVATLKGIKIGQEKAPLK